MKLRPSAVAGLFYPDQPDKLKIQVERLLAAKRSTATDAPKALIVPHAGYVYSGSTAASAYCCLGDFSQQYTRVVLLGPAHRVAFYGLALSSATAFQTPLGNIPLVTTKPPEFKELPQAFVYDAAHEEEHSLEVQLPFLQSCLDNFELVPIVVGESSAADVAEVLEVLWGGPETLILVSTDLSHFLAYEQARVKDSQTNSRILKFATDLDGEEACGCRVLNGFLKLAKEKQLSIDLLALENSGDTAGDHSRVVGYGAYVLH